MYLPAVYATQASPSSTSFACPLLWEAAGVKIQSLFNRIRVDECHKISKGAAVEWLRDGRGIRPRENCFKSNCHFENSGKPAHVCPRTAQEGGPVWKACIGSMSESAFGIFTQFSLDIERICSEINLDRFQLSVENVVAELHSTAAVSSQIIGEITKSSAEIIKEVDASKSAVIRSTEAIENKLTSGLKRLSDGLLRSVELEAELILLQQQSSAANSELFEKFASDQERAQEKMGSIMEAVAVVEEAIRSWIPVIETIRDTTSSTHMSISSVKAGVFYASTLVLLWLLTARLSSVRLICVFFYSWSLALECFLSEPVIAPLVMRARGIRELSPAEASMLLESIAWTIRAIFCAAALFFLTRRMVSHMTRPRLSRQTRRILRRVEQHADAAKHSEGTFIDMLIDHIVQWRVWAAGGTPKPAGRTLLDTSFEEVQTPSGSGHVVELSPPPQLSPQLQKLLSCPPPYYKKGVVEETEDSDDSGSPSCVRYAVSDAPLAHAVVRRKSEGSPIHPKKRGKRRKSTLAVETEALFAPEGAGDGSCGSIKPYAWS